MVSATYSDCIIQRGTIRTNCCFLPRDESSNQLQMAARLAGVRACAYTSASICCLRAAQFLDAYVLTRAFQERCERPAEGMPSRALVMPTRFAAGCT